MSATPIRPEEMLDTVEVYFKGNLFHELSLSMAWYYKILPVPVLVRSVFDLNNQLDKVQRMLNRSDCTLERRKHIQDKICPSRLSRLVECIGTDPALSSERGKENACLL